MAKLYFYYSAMNAGKTTTLLQASYNYRERAMNTMIFSPSIDDRYDRDKVVSRIGIESEAVLFDKDFDFSRYFDAYQRFKKETLHCLLVDESQFLTYEQVLQLCHIVDFHHLPILCYGLRTNYMGKSFEGSAALLSLADELVELKAICHCGSKANMTLRVGEDGKVIEEGEEIDIGGNEKYVSVCRKHFFLKDIGEFIQPICKPAINYLNLDDSL